MSVSMTPGLTSATYAPGSWAATASTNVTAPRLVAEYTAQFAIIRWTAPDDTYRMRVFAAGGRAARNASVSSTGAVRLTATAARTAGRGSAPTGPIGSTVPALW